MDDDLQQLGEALLRAARPGRDAAAVRALVEEGTILAMPAVRRALVADGARGSYARWEGLSGQQYTLGLDDVQLAFLGLVLSMLGIGLTPISAVTELDERRLPILLRAIVEMAGDSTLAVGRRL